MMETFYHRLASSMFVRPSENHIGKSDICRLPKTGNDIESGYITAVDEFCLLAGKGSLKKPDTVHSRDR